MGILDGYLSRSVNATPLHACFEARSAHGGVNEKRIVAGRPAGDRRAPREACSEGSMLSGSGNLRPSPP